MSEVEISDEWFRSLSYNRKGKVGEGLAKTYTRSIVENRPHVPFPVFESVRDQRKVMGIVNESDNYFILRADVRFHADFVAKCSTRR